MVTRILADSQFGKAADGISLLLNEIGCGNKKSDFLFILSRLIHSVIFIFQLLGRLLNQLGVVQTEYLQDEHYRNKGLATPCSHKDNGPTQSPCVVLFPNEPPHCSSHLR